MANDLRRLNNWRKHPQVHSLLQPWCIHGETKRTEPCEWQNSVLKLNKSNFLGSDHFTVSL